MDLRRTTVSEGFRIQVLGTSEVAYGFIIPFRVWLLGGVGLEVQTPSGPVTPAAVSELLELRSSVAIMPETKP